VSPAATGERRALLLAFAVFGGFATSLPVALGLLGVIGLLLVVAGPVILRSPVEVAQLRS